jgi:CBS domain-containing protein
MADEPPSAKSEFWVAVAGPIMSVLIGALCLAALAIPLPVALAVVLAYLGAINLLLVVFNMIPAFPLDGGRVLRSILWAAKGNLRWATKVTSTIGSAFGIVLIGLGLLSIVRGNVLGGFWWVLIGMFLRQAASMSYQQLLLRRALEGEKVSRFMKLDPVTVPPQATVADLVNHFVYRYRHKLFPVTENGHLLGCVSTAQIKNLPENEWQQHTVGEIAGRCTAENTVSPETDAIEALAKMNRTGGSRLMVVDRGNLVGILTLKDLMKFMSLKVELEEQ